MRFGMCGGEEKDKGPKVQCDIRKERSKHARTREERKGGRAQQIKGCTVVTSMIYLYPSLVFDPCVHE